MLGSQGLSGVTSFNMQTGSFLSRRLTLCLGRISVAHGVFLSSQFCTQLDSKINSVEYHRVADETLDELAEYLEELPDREVCHSDYDVHLADGVLTLQLGGKSLNNHIAVFYQAFCQVT
jgi:hypothetical protein